MPRVVSEVAVGRKNRHVVEVARGAEKKIGKGTLNTFRAAGGEELGGALVVCHGEGVIWQNAQFVPHLREKRRPVQAREHLQAYESEQSCLIGLQKPAQLLGNLRIRLLAPQGERPDWRVDQDAHARDFLKPLAVAERRCAL